MATGVWIPEMATFKTATGMQMQEMTTHNMVTMATTMQIQEMATLGEVTMVTGI
jgi:hypothetical protein